MIPNVSPVSRKTIPAHYLSQWIVSVDVGQSIDPTAIAALEVRTRMAVQRDVVCTQDRVRRGERVEIDSYDAHASEPFNARDIASISVRHLERMPLRTAYPDVVAHIARMLQRAPLRGATLILDQTGVGRPVVDLVRRAGLRPIAVTITAGDAESTDHQRNWRVAKSLLVSHLQASLHCGELRIAKGLTEARTLTAELQDFRATTSENGYTRFGAREGRHDDLVLSVAQGVWWARRRKPPTMEESIGTFSF